MKIEALQLHKKILLAGYGKEGKTTHAFLNHFVPNAQVDIADQSEGVNYLDKQVEYDLVIKSPGIHKSLIKVPYTTATNIFFANVQNTTIGVTGSKGKSTTTSLIYEILKSSGENVSIVGNIGKPMLNELLRKVDTKEIFVVELSSYQLDDIHYSPHISVVISLFPEHMNYHGTVEAYYEAKHNIIHNAKPEDYYIYNGSVPTLAAWAHSATCKSLPFIDTLPDYVKEVPLYGMHNNSNIRGAITVAQVLGISPSNISDAIKNFKSLPHRLQVVGTYKGITFIDDANAATPEAAIAAMDSFEKIGTVFLGGQDRGYNFEALAHKVIEKKVDNVVIFPDTGEKIWNEIKKASPETLPNHLETKDLEEAVKFSYLHTPPGTVCLMSMGSPSYSIWKNFEEKGDLFQQFVKELGSE